MHSVYVNRRFGEAFKQVEAEGPRSPYYEGMVAAGVSTKEGQESVIAQLLSWSDKIDSDTISVSGLDDIRKLVATLIGIVNDSVSAVDAREALDATLDSAAADRTKHIQAIFARSVRSGRRAVRRVPQATEP